MNVSLVVRFLLNKLQSEHEAYVGVLKYLLLHLETGEFSEENFLKAIENATSGFQAQFHDSAANAAYFFKVLTNRVSEYKDLKQPTPEQKYAIQRHMEIVNAGSSALREMNSFRDRVTSRTD